jgi:hypothetical protein
MESVSRHQCLICHGPSVEQLPTLAPMMLWKLAENYRCLYLSSPAMVSAMRAHLSTLRVRIVDEVIKTNLVLLSDSTLNAEG